MLRSLNEQFLIPNFSLVSCSYFQLEMWYIFLYFRIYMGMPMLRFMFDILEIMYAVSKWSIPSSCHFWCQRQVKGSKGCILIEFCYIQHLTQFYLFFFHLFSWSPNYYSADTSQACSKSWSCKKEPSKEKSRFPALGDHFLVIICFSCWSFLSVAIVEFWNQQVLFGMLWNAIP